MECVCLGRVARSHWVTLGIREKLASFWEEAAAAAQSRETAQEAQDELAGRIWAGKSGFGQDLGVTAELE